MKVKVDNTEIFELKEWEKDVIKNDVKSEEFEADMKRRLEWVLKHKVERCYERLQKEWTPKLKIRGIVSIPANPESFLALVKSQIDYKNRSQREAKG